jgi:hypothetical protein
VDGNVIVGFESSKELGWVIEDVNTDHEMGG